MPLTVNEISAATEVGRTIKQVAYAIFLRVCGLHRKNSTQAIFLRLYHTYRKDKSSDRPDSFVDYCSRNAEYILATFKAVAEMDKSADLSVEEAAANGSKFWPRNIHTMCERALGEAPTDREIAQDILKRTDGKPTNTLVDVIQ